MRIRFRIPVLALTLAAGAAPLAGQVPDRSVPPKLGPPPRLSLPPIQQATLSNGLNVLLMEKHQVPVVEVNLVVRGGSVLDPNGKVGLASMTADMMDEGAGGRDALELADAIDFLGANISTFAGSHTSGVTLYTPVSKLDGALPLMADVALRPTFPEQELERKRRSRLTTLLQWHDQPGAIASALINEELYHNHPYGHSSVGDEASIRALSVSDLRSFHDTYFVPNNAVVIVVGDVTSGTIMPKLEAAFGSWPRGTVPSASWPDPGQVARTEVLLVDRPGSAQSEIRIGRVGVPRATDDYFSLQVMNNILGGAFTSRLNQNLREDKGYTYGAGSSFSYRELPGPFIASSAVQTDATDKALTEFFKEFDGIRQPVPADELERGKNYVALRYPGGFQSVRGIAGNIEDLWEYHLPTDYFNQFVDRVLAVTQADVQRVARRYVVPNRMLVVIVGDRAKIEAGVRALNLGPLRVLSIDDVLGPKPEVGE
jgi:zinc protease